MPYITGVPRAYLPQNLVQLLRHTAKANPTHGLCFYRPGKLHEDAQRLTYPEFLWRVEENAERLHQLGLRPGSNILLHFSSHLDNLEWFWAVTIAGFTPAMSTPFSSNVEQRRKHIVYLSSLLEDPICLTTSSSLPEFACQDTMKIQLIEEIPPRSPSSNGFFQRDGLHYPVDQGNFKNPADHAALMLTSGSTGNAKAVCLSHDMILSSVANKMEALETGPDDIFLNWIGADHVACLTEMHIHAMLIGAEQIYAQAVDVVPSPLDFLDIIQKQRVTHSFAPNFFLAEVRRALDNPDSEKFTSTLDLSSLKRIVTGGEANVVESCIAVTKIFEQYGTPRNILRPAYGMTETCGGSIYSKCFPQYDFDHENEFASVGCSVLDMRMRIVDDDGNEVIPGQVGSLEVRGSNIFQRYYNNEEATMASFRDGWFMTGDLGSIDELGMLNLVGRAKETLIINGVNYAPQDIEAVLAEVEGTKPSFTVAFPYRPKNSPTEGLCVVYLPTYKFGDIDARVAANDTIIKLSMLQTGVRPLVIPLVERMLQKSTLGKLARTKIKKAYENGDYDQCLRQHESELERFRAERYEPPTTETERVLLGIFEEFLDVPGGEIGVNTNLYTFGVNSVDIIKIKNKLEKVFNVEIPMIPIVTNLTIRGLATTLQDMDRPREYDPMVVLQASGSETPLWLIHPGLGEVLVFMPLASYFNDRPVYAMRASGFEKGESYTTSIPDLVATYHKRIKSAQPNGPYAIAGYSFGSMIAFEIAKLLEANHDEIKFLGAFNLPPHIKLRMRDLDWTHCLLHLSYFLDFFTEDWAHDMQPILRTQPHPDVIEQVLAKAPPARVAELGLDAAKLDNWANLAFSLQNAATEYDPSGSVPSMDVFCAVPLRGVADGMDDWMDNHLAKWKDFCRDPPKFHRVEGAHYTMIGPGHVHSFQKTLKKALRDRGL